MLRSSSKILKNFTPFKTQTFTVPITLRTLSTFTPPLYTNIDKVADKNIYDHFDHFSDIDKVSKETHKPYFEIKGDFPRDQVFYSSSYSWRKFVEKGMIGTLGSELFDPYSSDES
ncbi:hypothetical protein BB560_002831 [Smittium megazygosporum]|uniref:Uncharacterized protein n=1 Tax=Smittium megazygosporum TaxID=133381 RepID=A0A2T9ZDM7_9FUNG|nr:hypothetical protein BB560_002831 [Smittium megazygosporum]